MRKFFLFTFILLCNLAYGQKGLELGGWIGTSQYFGDLHTELTVSDLGLSGGIIARYNLDERISIKSSFNYARISASDADSPNTFERARNLSFFSDIYDATLQAEFNFLPYFHGSKDQFFTPYLFAGISMFAFSPKAELDGVTYNLRDFGTEGQAIRNEYSRFSRALTYGVGMKWDINYDWSFNVELSVHNSQTDYLDDVSSVYPDLNVLAQVRGETAVALSDRSLTGGIGEPMRQRGNNKADDIYVLFGIGVVKYFGTIPCPDVSKRKRVYRKKADTLNW